MKRKRRRSKLGNRLLGFLGVCVGCLVCWSNLEHAPTSWGRILWEENEEELSVIEIQATVGIALVLIAITLLFEAMKTRLEQGVSEDFLVVVEKLFGEMTVLGVLSLITFIVTPTTFFRKAVSQDLWKRRRRGTQRTLGILPLCHLFHYGFLYFPGPHPHSFRYRNQETVAKTRAQLPAAKSL